MKSEGKYQTLGNLFRYPDQAGYLEGVDAVRELVLTDYPQHIKKFERFYSFIQSNDLFQIEEIFNLTFHIQAICYLDLGYVLFGEDYKRGEFLVNMKVEQENAKIDCGFELPDNLPLVLELLDKHPDPHFRNEMAVRIIIPALEKMSKEFDMARIELRKKVFKKKEKVVLDKDLENGNVYGDAIQLVFEIVKEDFANISFSSNAFEPEYGRNFLINCGTCGEHETLVPQKK